MKIIKPEEIIKKFKEETGYTLGYNDGVYSYGDSLNLAGAPIQSLPDNLTVGGYLNLEGAPKEDVFIIKLGERVEYEIKRLDKRRRKVARI